MSSVEERLTDLEIRYVYQSKVIATLDEVVQEFAARVEQLERQLAALGAAADPGDVPAAATVEKPPHY